MRGRKPAADFQLLADRDRAAQAAIFSRQILPEGPAPASRSCRVPEIDAGPWPGESAPAPAGCRRPASGRVQGLQVKRRQDPLQKVTDRRCCRKRRDGSEANRPRHLFRGDRRTRPVSVSHAGKIGEGCIFPGGCVNICPSAAAFVVARVADLAPLVRNTPRVAPMARATFSEAMREMP